MSTPPKRSGPSRAGHNGPARAGAVSRPPAHAGPQPWHVRTVAWARGAIGHRTARHRAAVKLLRDATLEAQRSKLPQMAAALSYRTVFGLIPVLVVALVAMKLFFTTDKEIAGVLNQAMQYSGLAAVAATPAESPDQMGPFPEDAGYQAPESPEESQAGGGSAGSTRPEIVPPDHPPATPEQRAAKQRSAERVDEWIKDTLTRIRSVNFRAIGLIGAIALVYAAISMLVEVERAFNQIYRVPLGRSWSRRIVNYWTLLTLGSVGLGLSFYVTQAVGTELTHFANAERIGEGGSEFAGVVLGFISTVTISTVMFLLVYSVIPNTRVQFTAALSGAVVAAVVWEASKWGFTQYLRFSHGYARLYGSIALIPLFLLWVYVTWCIVLFGLNVAYYLQHGRHHTSAEPADPAEPIVIDPGTILAALAVLARRFRAGNPADAGDISDELKIPTGISREMLASLAAAGVVHRVEQLGTEGDDEPLYALSRPPEQISAEEIVRLGDALTGAAGRGPVGEAMRAARLAAVHGRTLAAFVDGAVSAPSAATPRPVAP